MRTLRIASSRPFATFGLALLLALALPSHAYSQGCSLCYTQAANSGPRLIQALRSGIVILILPPLAICVAAMVLAYRRRNNFSQTDPGSESNFDW